MDINAKIVDWFKLLFDNASIRWCESSGACFYRLVTLPHVQSIEWNPGMMAGLRIPWRCARVSLTVPGKVFRTWLTGNGISLTRWKMVNGGRISINKSIAVRDWSHRKRVGTGHRKLYSLFVESDEFVLRIRLTRSVTGLLDQLEGRPSGEVI